MREAKSRAAERGETLTAFVEEALREHLRRDEDRGSRGFRLRLVTAEGGARPGVEVDDRGALYDVMEGRD